MTYTADQRQARNRDAHAFISKQFVRYGLTSVHHEGGDLSALLEVRDRGDLLHRVSYEPADDMVEILIAQGFATGFGDEWVKLGATYEHTCDGSFSERTMALSVPYPGVVPPYQGNVTTTQEDLNAWVERVHRGRIQVNCHANGDVAIDMVLTAFERAQRVFPRPDPRPKITHCTLINDDLVRRIKAAGGWLALREAEQALLFGRTGGELPPPEDIPLEDLSVHLLQRALQRLIEEQKRRAPREVEPNPLSVLERMNEILELLRHTWSLLFSSVAGREKIRAEWVVTLLALLELVRLGQVRARQAEPFGEITIDKSTVIVGGPADATLPDAHTDNPEPAK